MAVIREQPYAGFNFLVEIDGVDGPQNAICEVILPQAWLDVIEYRAGNGRDLDQRKITGLEHYTNLTLKRGINGSLTFWQWYNQTRNGASDAARSVSVILLDEESRPVWSWRFLRARPVKYVGPDLNGRSSDVAIETLELAFERLEIE